MQLYKSLDNTKEIFLIFGGFASHYSHFAPFFKNYLLLYHYTHLDFSALLKALKTLPKDSKITLVAFSMGVFVARIFLNTQHFKPHKAFAINGTEYGIHKSYGIPLALFRHTQKNFATNKELALKQFKSNLFLEHLDKTEHFVFLDSNILCDELEFFMESCATHHTLLEPICWDFALISTRDLIYNPQAQKAFWSDKTRIIELDAPHFAFFNWKF
ncbi:pimeloyl-ACP methyl esterase BioG family protein [uncultured Helicobacter sp.]|uniref:pimeloyl-ACP methyl esterase BioG family protein n=1 Tax=uncultured Helicobacter sp. TaxID=175537 RepID=UPI002632D8A9|nr:pimeloyl-ACP methyl esterase BioG family protein [uncultured Helicobacter sp.]